MKIERTKNAIRNMFFGVIIKIYQILIPFIMRTIMIYFMGVQYLGLNSLFVSILQVLNLAELGVGSAMVYSMYKPISEDDTTTICALMKLYKVYYRVIGLIIALLGLIALPFIPRLIKSDMPPGINIYILYLMNLGITVISYWLYAYKNCLFQAHQRIDIVSKVTLVINTIQYLLQIIIMIFLKNYYLFISVALILQAINNIVVAYFADKIYPDYKAIGKLDETSVKEINHRIRDLFTSKVGSVIVNSADTIVISAFLGLTVLAEYQNYFYILSSIIGFVAIIYSSCMAGIGNSIIVESKEKNYNDLCLITFMISWISGFCVTCLLCLYQPFMKIWVGNKLMLDDSIVICLCIYYFIYEINQLLNMYKDAAGIWHKDRFRPLITALTNLVLNIIMVQYWGLYGIVLSTVISTVAIGMPWLLHNLFLLLFGIKRLKSYIKLLLRYTTVVVLGCSISYFICSIKILNMEMNFFIRLICCCSIPNILYYIVYRNTKEFKSTVLVVKKIIKTKYKFKNRSYLKKYEA